MQEENREQVILGFPPLGVLRDKRSDLACKQLLQGDQLIFFPRKITAGINADGSMFIKTKVGEGYVCPHGIFIGDNGIVEAVCLRCARGEPKITLEKETINVPLPRKRNKQNGDE